MKGAIFYASKYGSTKQYAQWIADTTDLPVYNIEDKQADPTKYDFLILGSPIIYFRLYIRKWVREHLTDLEDKPIIFFSVSGSPPGERLDNWVAKSLPAELISKMHYVALLGKQNPQQLTFFDRTMLLIGSLFNPDRQASKDEREGFDYMKKSSIQPIVEMARQYMESRKVTSNKKSHLSI